MLDATDLVALIGEHVALKPKGREHVGLCPFHDDRSPSLAVVSHKGGAFYKCFSCGAAGNAIDFMMGFHKLGFPEALRHLAQRAGIELTSRFERRSDSAGAGRDLLHAANQFALRWFRRNLTDAPEGAPARAAVEERGVQASSVEAFQLGYAPDRRDGLEFALERLRRHQQANGARREGEKSPAALSLDALLEAGLLRSGREGPNDLFRHRLIFPICDELGRPIAFGGRKLRAEDEPKYINTPESPLFHKSRSLYGIHLAKQAIVKSRTAVVTEGYTDVIACHAAGCTNVVATLGTALTREHARVLRRLCDRVILLFDGDAAGIRAAERGVEVFFAEPIDVQVCTLPDGLDPDELLRTPEGPERFRAALERAVDALGFLVERFRREYVTRPGISGRQQLLEGLLRKLAELGFGQVSGVRKRFILASLADLTRLSERELESALAAAVASTRPVARREEPAGDSPIEQPPEQPPVAEAPLPPPISRARREAERHLLAILLAVPEGAATSVECGLVELGLDDASSEGSVERTTLPLLEALHERLFADPLHRAVFARWRDLLEGGIEGGVLPGPARLLAELVEPGAKSLASELFVFGETLAVGVRSSIERPPERFPERSVDSHPDRPIDRQALIRFIVSAFTDLDCIDRRERSRSAATFDDDTPTDSRTPLDLTTALDRIAQRRRRGADATVSPTACSAGASAPTEIRSR